MIHSIFNFEKEVWVRSFIIHFVNWSECCLCHLNLEKLIFSSKIHNKGVFCILFISSSEKGSNDLSYMFTALSAMIPPNGFCHLYLKRVARAQIPPWENPPIRIFDGSLPSNFISSSAICNCRSEVL